MSLAQLDGQGAHALPRVNLTRLATPGGCLVELGANSTIAIIWDLALMEALRALGGGCCANHFRHLARPHLRLLRPRGFQCLLHHLSRHRPLVHALQPPATIARSCSTRARRVSPCAPRALSAPAALRPPKIAARAATAKLEAIHRCRVLWAHSAHSCPPITRSAPQGCLGTPQMCPLQRAVGLAWRGITAHREV